jgi:hypothetical protein
MLSESGVTGRPRPHEESQAAARRPALVFTCVLLPLVKQTLTIDLPSILFLQSERWHRISGLRAARQQARRGWLLLFCG